MNSAALKSTTGAAMEAPNLRLKPSAPPIDPDLVTAIANAVAHKLVRQGAIRAADGEDFKSDLVAEATRRWPEFDPSRADPPVFLRLVIKRHATSLLRARLALKRGHGRCQSHGNLEELEGRTLPAAPGPAEDAALRVDMAAVISGLSAREQRLCRLISCMSLSAAARSLRISRPRLSTRVHRLRARFQKLEVYL